MDLLGLETRSNGSAEMRTGNGMAHNGSGMAVTRIAEELHRCASSRRAMEQLRTDQICNGKASSHCAQICKGEAPICSGTDALSNGKAVLCDGKERHRLAMAERRKALELLGYDLHCVGLAAPREARALIRQATELHCCAYAKALKGDVLHRHRGAMTRKRNGQHG